MKTVYLDNAATTKPKKEVIKVINKYLEEDWYNPSSLYSESQKIAKDIEGVRDLIRNDIGADKDDDIIFTSGGSEANCLAIEGFVKYHGKENSVVITSEIEHSSIMRCVDDLQRGGVDCRFIPVDESGYINQNILVSWLRIIPKNKNILVSVQAVNNETGVVQNIKLISNLVHSYYGILHVDAVQEYPTMKTWVKSLEIDMMSVSGHKFGCPKGIGFLYKSKNINIKPLVYGSQNNGLRGGTENVPYVMGMGKAIELLGKSIGEITSSDVSQSLKKYGIHYVFVSDYPASNNIISIQFYEDFTAEGLLYYLDSVGIKVSLGSACDSHDKKPSHVLKAIGLSDEESKRVIRISLSSDNTEEDIDRLVKGIKEYKELVCAK